MPAKVVFVQAEGYVWNYLLSGLFLAEIPWFFISVFQHTPENRPVLALYILLICVFIKLADLFNETVGNALSDGPFRNPPFSRPLKPASTMIKFKANMWALMIHISMVFLEIYVLSTVNDTQYIPNVAQGILDLNPSPAESPWMTTLYLLQMAIWTVTAFFHIFIIPKQADYLVMLGHHVATLFLIGLSFQYGLTRLGLAILFIHDISDIPVDLLKITNYLKLEGSQGLYIVELTFATNLISWFYYRLFCFPYYILYGMCYKGMTCFSCSNDVHFLHGGACTEQDWDECRNAHVPFDPTAGNIAFQFKMKELGVDPLTLINHANFGIGVLGILLTMHCWWLYLFMKILAKILRGEVRHEIGRQEYEGNSDDEGDEIGVDKKIAVKRSKKE